MWSNIKHLGLGFFIGLLAVAFMLLWVLYVTADITNEPVIYLPPIFKSPTSTNTPVTPTLTRTITATPTLTRTPTRTFTPSSTATKSAVEQMVADGKIIFSGPLTQVQQIKLYETSLEFIAPTTKQAREVGVTINGTGYGSPSLICGPLSLAIMQAADLIQYEDIVPFDFWLLNPYVSKDRALLNRVFPEARYEDTLYTTPINEFGWRTFPLHPGDFLYIRHGAGGNFDHMLVVSRVDSQLRAYAVTNFQTPDGFIIDEVLLYDPRDSMTGMFHEWTERRNSPSGSTGFGGFEIWRLLDS